MLDSKLVTSPNSYYLNRPEDEGCSCAFLFSFSSVLSFILPRFTAKFDPFICKAMSISRTAVM